MVKNIQCFETLEGLLKEITNDKNSKSMYAHRFPVRFIFLPELWQLKKLVKALTDVGVKILELTDVLPNDDGWLTSDQIIEIITQREKQKDFIVVPFSEIARFYSKDDFIAVLNSLTEIENVANAKRRIYIPFIGLYERFEKTFLTTFSRRGEWAPIWGLSENHEKKNKITIYLTAFDVLDIKDIELIKNAKEWLNIWKEDDVRRIICLSKTLSYLYKNTLPDQVFDIKKINNYKNLILEIFNIDIPIHYKEDDKQLWRSLLKNILREKTIKNFENLVTIYFNRASIKNDEIIDLWLEKNDELGRWLLKWWLINEPTLKDDYIHLVMDSLEIYTNAVLLDTLWFRIFDYEMINKNWIHERKNYLKQFYRNSDTNPEKIEDKLKDRLTSVLSKKDKIENKLRLLTDITTYERKLVLELIKGKETDYFDSLKEVYPSLYYYLLPLEVANLDRIEWIKEYFEEYKHSKLNNFPSDKLKEILGAKNKNDDSFYKWYYSVDDYYSIVKEEAEELIWIDGMGLEWLSLFVRLIDNYSEEHGVFVEKKYVARTNLPSITECNRYENANYVRNLDRFIHSENPYRHPDDLIKEIELIDAIIKREILSSNKSKICVVSDHGFTVFPQSQYNNIKKYNFKESDHEGRCMWTDETFSGDVDFILHNPESKCGNGKKSLVALRYASLNNLPRREVHGGATPEEALVPVIIISKKVEKVSYEISPLHHEISIRSPNLYISIFPEPRTTPILVCKENNKELELRYDPRNNKWWTQLKGFKAGSYNFNLRIGTFEKKISAEIKGGLKERDLL